MSGQTVLILLFVLSLAFVGVGLLLFNAEHEMTGIMTAALAVMAALSCLGVLIAVPISRSVDRTSCQRWSDATGREIKFVDYHYGSWDCLTKSGDWRWIAIGQLRDEVSE